MNKNFFSIVIPLHNKALHIHRAICSVLNQTFQNFDLIIVNDASTDDSVQEVQKFNDPKIRLLHRDIPGPGGYAARNLGVEESHAEWVAFLDADDEWMPVHLERMHAMTQQFNQAGVMGCGCRIITSEEGVGMAIDSYTAKRGGQGDHYLSFEQYLEAEVLGIRPLNGSTACIKKKVLQEVGGFPAGKARRGGDVDTWLRCIEKAGGVAFGDYIGAIYHRNSVNMVTRIEPLWAQVERDTVKALLARHTGKTAKLLKQFANNRTIHAWQQNSALPKIKNENLFGKLYLTVDTFKNFAWTALSCTPPTFFLWLKKNRNHGKFRIGPVLKQTPLADLARSGRACFQRLITKPKPKGWIRKCQYKALSNGSNPTFFGYHDKTPFCLDGSKILAMSITASDRTIQSECTPMRLGYFQKSNPGDFENAFIPFAETMTWCFQQGCMLQWHPNNLDRWVLFNTIVEDGYGSKVVDVETGETIRTYAHPVYSLDPTGNLAATLNFSRLGRLRPGYGYPLLPDNTQHLKAPEEDGLFVFDLITGEKKLLVSLPELAHGGADSASQHYINHATFAPDGKHIVFFHLWSREGSHQRRVRVCVVDVARGVWQEIESERLVSHYCWRDAHTFLATAREQTGIWRYTLYDIVENQKKDLALPFNEDLHPMYHPINMNKIVVDTYPDRRREQHVCIVDTENGRSEEIGSFYTAPVFRGQIRCDLHSRWDREGRYVAIDSTHTGKRQVVIINYQ